MGFGLSARNVARVIGAAAVTAGAMLMSAPGAVGIRPALSGH